MIFKFIMPKKTKKKRKIKIVRKYVPKDYVTKEDKVIFNSFMEEKEKEGR